MGPAALAQVLRPLTLATHPDLVVGLQTSDDAAVYRLAPDLAVVQTVDFFTPIVDDPWTYGAIAAANSMSDVYAMGGDVLFALNVAGFPDTLPPAMITAIFEGAAAKVAEAGAIIAGGHTVTDAEPKFGLVVTGTIHPERVWTKAGARPGDRLFLTKPIGTGIVATALKREKANPDDVEAATASMLALNRAAAETARAADGVDAATDITGFGLLGHASEMAARSGAGLRIDASAVPLLPGVIDYATAGHVAGGLGRNRDHFAREAGGIRFDPAVDPVMQAILFDPQTSGGLLFAVDPTRAKAFRAAFAAANLPLAQIGEVIGGAGIDVAP
jgi:selenide,water dikinase